MITTCKPNEGQRTIFITTVFIKTFTEDHLFTFLKRSSFQPLEKDNDRFIIYKNRTLGIPDTTLMN